MSANATDIEAYLLPLKGMIFDLPEEQREEIMKIKAAVMLTAGPHPTGLLGTMLAMGELAKLLEGATK